MPKPLAQPSEFISRVSRERPEYLIAIATISVEVGAMEFMLAAMLGGLLHTDYSLAQAVYFTPKAAIARLEMITNTAAVRFEAEHPARREIKKIVKRAASIMGRRHDIIHAVWGVAAEGAAHAYAIRKGVPTTTPVPLRTLNDLIEEIRIVTARISNFLRQQPSPLQQKSSALKRPKAPSRIRH